MNKEDVVVIAQLFTSMKDATKKLENALEKKDLEEVNKAKKEILILKEEIDKIL
ncbi:MAG: hypothetical protein Q8L29_02950 [archaeon]|nr:hypothetical protein [archaeon]